MNLKLALFLLHMLSQIRTNEASQAKLDTIKEPSQDLNPTLDKGLKICHEKCICPDDETIFCQGITTDDLSKNIFGVKLKTIELQKSDITKLPKSAFMNLANLKHLILTDNQLEEIPTEVLSFFTQLETIDLSNNLISKVKSDAFGSNKNLQNINLSHNRIYLIENDAFKKIKSLRKLNVQSNRLTRLPMQIAEIKGLTEINIGKNLIETISDGILQKCPQLEEIDFRGNPLKSFHNNAFAGLPNLKKLVIADLKNNSFFPNLNGTKSLTVLRMDRSKLSNIPTNLCRFCPQLRSLELKHNHLDHLPDLRECNQLRLIDLGHNNITSLKIQNVEASPFETLTHLHDLILHHNSINRIEKSAFYGLKNLQVLDLMANKIDEIHDEAFENLDALTDLNLGENTFSKFPTKGLQNIVHLKTHNNPNLVEFPGSGRFPNVQNLVLSYAYHCCQFMPSTFENLIHEFANFGGLRESVFLPGEEFPLDHTIWGVNLSEPTWIFAGNDTSGLSGQMEISNFGLVDKFEMPHPGIQCMPAPGTFLPCNDLFDWWTLRCSIWVVFLLALMGNGCVVIVLVSSRGKMDVPRFLVCNLAAADFCMGLYLGFLAVVDASTLGEFRRYAISWQFSSACQVAGFFGVLSSELSIFTLAVITLERNYAITHAMHLNKRLSLRHAAYIMACGWTYGILMASMPLVGISDYRKFAVCLPFETGDSLSLGYVIFLTLINGVGFTILMGCYLKMYCAIRGSQAWNSNDSRIAKRMALLVFTDFICWFPIALFALTSCFGVHLISLEQAKVFTIFVLPLNSCFNPFLYAILTKQFKKDCVMICKAIEESRVTRGIGRCRHSSNFSNRQTPANTNSLNSGSGTHGSNANPPHGKGNMCNCNLKKHKTPGSMLVSKWPLNKLKKIFLGYKDSGDLAGGLVVSGSEYAQQIAEIQHKQHKTKRHESLSSENFSSSRSDSWRLQGGHHPKCLQQRLQQQQQARQRANGVGPVSGQFNHRRRNSWTVTRKPSQESQMSSSRNDSNSSSNSTVTWRMSRSSVSSEANNAVTRTGSGQSNTIPLNAPIDPVTGKLNISLLHNQRIHSGGSVGRTPPSLLRIASENAAKPKLMRQPAILADADSSGSAKFVTFKDPKLPPMTTATRDQLTIEVAADEGNCPLHDHDIQKTLFDKLEVSSQEESDMEPSDAESEDQILTKEQDPESDPTYLRPDLEQALPSGSDRHTVTAEDEEQSEALLGPPSAAGLRKKYLNTEV